MIRSLTWLLLGVALILSGQSIGADEVKCAWSELGIHMDGAEGVAMDRIGEAPYEKPGGMMLRLPTTGLVPPRMFIDIQEPRGPGNTFADLAKQVGELRQNWQKEFAEQLGFGGGVVGGGAKAILAQAGNLTNADPKDRVDPTKRAKVHTVRLKGGQTVVLEIESGDGTAKPGFFDPYLRLEDPKGTILDENDDCATSLNSRLEFTPERDGQFRLIVTSFRSGATGAYILTVRQK
jgi:hypothetical protein